MGKILIVYYSHSGNTKAAAEAVAQGVRSVDGTEAVLKKTLESTAEDLLSCDAVALGSPDYFGYMGGSWKDFFDRTLYPTQGSVTDKPCSIFVTHGGGGQAVESVKTICAAFKFKIVCEPVLVENAPDTEAQGALMDLGKLLAETAR